MIRTWDFVSGDVLFCDDRGPVEDQLAALMSPDGAQGSEGLVIVCKIDSLPGDGTTVTLSAPLLEESNATVEANA